MEREDAKREEKREARLIINRMEEERRLDRTKGTKSVYDDDDGSC